MKNNLPYYFNLYLNEYLATQKDVSKHTLLAYKYTFNGFLLFCVNIKNISINNISLDTFNNEIISQFLTYLEEVKHNSTATRNNKLKNIKSFLKFVYPHESSRMLQIQNILNIPMKKDIDKPVEYMTVDVLKILLEQPKTATVNGRRDLTLLATLYDTGARVSELINLKVRDVKFDKTTTTIRLFGKGSKVRIVPVIGNTSNLLSKYFKEHNLENNPDSYVFVSKLKQPLTEPGVKYIIEKYRSLAEKVSPLVPKNIYPHMFRHSKAMHLLESGVNYIYIRDFLGHSNIKTTEIYAKISVEQKRKVLNEAYQENVPKSEEKSWNKDKDLLDYLMKL